MVDICSSARHIHSITIEASALWRTSRQYKQRQMLCSHTPCIFARTRSFLASDFVTTPCRTLGRAHLLWSIPSCSAVPLLCCKTHTNLFALLTAFIMCFQDAVVMNKVALSSVRGLHSSHWTVQSSFHSTLLINCPSLSHTSNIRKLVCPGNMSPTGDPKKSPSCELGNAWKFHICRQGPWPHQSRLQYAF